MLPETRSANGPAFDIRVHCEDIHLGHSGGIENYVKGILRGFEEIHVIERVTIIASPGEGAGWLDVAPNAACVVEVPGHISWGGTLASHAKKVMRRIPAAQALRAASRQRRLGTHANEPPTADFFPYHRARTYGRHQFVTVHDLRVFDPRFADAVSQKIISQNVGDAAAVFCSWRHPRRQLERRFPQAIHKIHEVPFPPMLEPTFSRAGGGSFLLYPAATSSHKNHNLLLAYAEQWSDPPIVCVGPKVEPIFSALSSQALIQAPNLSMRGVVSTAELERLYAESWAVVMPSKYEAASGPVMEAFARGVPVIAANTPAIVDQVEQCGAEAVWFNANSPASLRAAVERLRSEYSYFAEASAKGGEWYRELGWARTAQEYLDVMNQHMIENA